MNARTQVTLNPEMQRRAQAKAAELNISFAEYVRRLVALDLGDLKRKADVSALFDLADTGSKTNIARDNNEMVAEAILQEHSSGRGKKKTTFKLKTSRR